MVETFRFHTLNGSSYIQTQLDGTFVRHSDYATLEAQLAEKEAENVRLKKELGGAHTAIRGLYGAVVTKDEALSRTGAVKVLEWERRWMNAESQTEIGLYNITYRRDGSFEWSVGDHKGWAATWDNAKAAAQADYEHRILSAREPAAPPSDVSTEGQQPVAWRLDYPLGTQWCDDKYALQVAVDEGGAKVTPLYTRPSESSTSGEPAVTEVHAKTFYEKYFEDVSELEPRWDDLPFDHRLRTLNALKAAMEAGR